MNKLNSFLAILFLLTSCNLIMTGTQQSDIIGTDGLVMTLPKLPTELVVGQGLEIPITLENVGVHDVQNAILAVAGYNPSYVHFSPAPKTEGINLAGRSNLVPVGEKTSKIFTINSVSLPDAKERDETFAVYACYQYKTEASPVVCINPQLAFGESAVKSGCTFVDAQISPSQGAPVAVTKVESYYLTNKQQMRFVIYVKDVSGKGVIINSQSYAKRCVSSESLADNELNSVDIEVFLSGEKLPCYTTSFDNPVDKFIIAGDSPSIACVANINSNDAGYTTPLSISLSYGYVIGKTFNIKLKNPQFGLTG